VLNPKKLTWPLAIAILALLQVAAAAPDLYVSEFSLSPEQPVQGSPVSVRVGVYNQGNSASGPFTVHWLPGENYREPACTWYVEGLAARGGRILTCTYEGYPSWYSQLNTKVVIDGYGQVVESDEGNNVYIQAISVSKPSGSWQDYGNEPEDGYGLFVEDVVLGQAIIPNLGASQGQTPDLFISEFSLSPDQPVEGSPVSVRVGVYNKGSKASGPFSVAWWPGENYPQPACSWNVDGLVANGGRILTCTYEGYPSWYGFLTTKAVADTSNQVAESDEDNNAGTKTISVSKASPPSQAPEPQQPSSQKPDLFVSEFSLSPSPPVQGQPVQVRVGVYNKGTGSSGPFTVKWLPGENYQQPGCSWQVDNLVANGGRILTCTYQGYPSWYGQLVTMTVVDSSNQVTESNENNNANRETIKVLKP
jgi:hypothetical protein